MQEKELLAEYRGLSLEEIEKHKTLQKEYPAFFKDNPNTEEKVKTAINLSETLDYELEKEFGDTIKSNFEEKFAEKKDIKKYRIRKYRDTKEYANNFLTYCKQELNNFLRGDKNA